MDDVKQTQEKISSLSKSLLEAQGEIARLREALETTHKQECYLPDNECQCHVARILRSTPEPEIVSKLRDATETLKLIGHPGWDFWKGMTEESIRNGYEFDIQRANKCLHRINGGGGER